MGIVIPLQEGIYFAFVVVRVRPLCDHMQEELLAAVRGK
jgi:hypothetical protein